MTTEQINSMFSRLSGHVEGLRSELVSNGLSSTPLVKDWILAGDFKRMAQKVKELGGLERPNIRNFFKSPGIKRVLYSGSRPTMSQYCTLRAMYLETLERSKRWKGEESEDVSEYSDAF